MRIASASTLALVTFSLPVHGQAIRGTVAVIETGERIDRAAVMLIGTDGAAHAAMLTDSTGQFSLEAPEPGAYVVRAQRVDITAQRRRQLRSTRIRSSKFGSICGPM